MSKKEEILLALFLLLVFLFGFALCAVLNSEIPSVELLSVLK